ncbi:sensor protein FixL [Mariprofundus micogutta]|uniref:Sensor protein FixL n=1 Tax=Mariprofundus micogutta TaxID=1921010 RepID=A0A1L8CK29_9PROT|nr:PAS domain S-box protein [Mariprofundus micogutta]GAV19235.1 sensor protein FixL [Mariprofundus micogutta]
MLQRVGLLKLGILVAILFWIIEALLHSFIFGNDTFINNLFSPDADEIWMRVLISIAVIGFGYYAQHAVNQQKIMQEQIRKKSERLHEVIDCSYDAYVSMDSQGCINEWNRSAEVLFGWPRHKIIGKQITMIIPERLREAHIKGMSHYQQNKIGPWLYKPMHTQALHRDGFEFSVEMVVTPLKSEGALEFFAFIREQDH